MLPTSDTIELGRIDDHFAGLSLRGDAVDLVVDGRGIVTVDRHGAVLDEHRAGEHGLVDRSYNDLAAVGDASAPQYILLDDTEGYLYDPLTEQQTVRFCVVPGFVAPAQMQKNDAVAVSGDTIVANPRFYGADGALASSELRTYRLSDGTPISSVGLDGNLELQGLAVGLEALYGVAGDRLYRFTPDGRPLGDAPLDGVANATGLAVDNAAHRLFVLDGDAPRIAIFDEP